MFSMGIDEEFRTEMWLKMFMLRARQAETQQSDSIEDADSMVKEEAKDPKDKGQFLLLVFSFAKKAKGIVAIDNTEMLLKSF